MQQDSLFIVTVIIRFRQKCCPGDKKLLTSQLFSNKLILQQASAKGTRLLKYLNQVPITIWYMY